MEVATEGGRPQERLPRRERLTDEEMGNLLSAVGNGEAKAIVFGLMADGRIYTASDLHRKVLDAQGERIGWRMDKSLPFKYCEQTLSPIGLVTREILNPDLSTFGYQVTDSGRKMLPLVGLLLKFSQDVDPALVKFFGQTASPSKESTIQLQGGDEEVGFRKRAPLTRLRIFYELVTAPKLPIRVTDLTERLGGDLGFLEPHIVSLKAAGIIEYQATAANVPITYYRFLPGSANRPLPLHEMRKTLSQTIFDILRENQDKALGSDDIYQLLPDKQKAAYQNKTHLREAVSRISTQLVKFGFATVEKFKKDLKSEINLTDDQRAVLAGLVEICDRFQEQDPEILQEGERDLREILADPVSVSALFAKAKEFSSGANASPTEETESRILTIISSFPEGITNHQIREQLAQLEHKNSSDQRISQLTRRLEKSGLVSQGTTGSVKKFFLKTKPN